MSSAFQMINVCLLIHSNSSQDSVFKVLSGLKSQLRQVESALHANSSASPGPSSGREDDRATQNLRQFVQVAENFHSSASTILREGPRSTVWGGSIMGDPLTEAQESMIERWIPPPVDEEPRSPVDADSDSETEFARRIEELAIKNEAEGDHAKAEQFYRGAIEHGESSSRPGSDITAMKIRRFQYPKAFGSQYTSPPTPSSYKDMAQYPIQHRQAMSNGESYSNSTISRKAIGQPDPIVSTMHHPESIESIAQLLREQIRRSTDLSYDHNNDMSGFGLALPIPPPPHPTGAYPQPTQGANSYKKQGYRSPPPPAPYNMASVPTPEPRCQIFVSVDFMNIDGASTRVAYVVNNLRNPISELLREWPGTGSYSKSSVPTVIYYDQSNKVVGWGHDTAEAIGPTGHPKPGVQKVEGLPLLLTQETEKSIPLPGTPPGLNAVDVSADFLYEIRRAIGTQLQQRIGNKFSENEQRIHWILTWPDIWADKRKTIWKRVLQRAGYLRDESDTRVSFVSQAEASIHDAMLRYSLSKEPQNPFIFAYFGNKAVHMCRYMLLKVPPFFAFCPMSSKNLGPTVIAAKFAETLRTRVRRMRLPRSSRIANKVYTKCVSDFEGRIISEFRNNGQEWDIDVAIETEFPDAGIKGGFMTFTNSEILSCFQPVMEGTTAMMADLISLNPVESNFPIEGIILGGEFCTSEYLLQEIKLKLPEKLRNKVYPPMEPATQVVTGAAHLALSRYLAQEYVQS